MCAEIHAQRGLVATIRLHLQPAAIEDQLFTGFGPKPEHGVDRTAPFRPWALGSECARRPRETGNHRTEHNPIDAIKGPSLKVFAFKQLIQRRGDI
jgi:hypothetical protein